MIIQRVFIDGFKNLSKVNLDLDDITALVSLNNFGKSNVLTAIDFAIDYIKADSEEKKDMMGLLYLFPLNTANAGQDYSFEIEALTKMNKTTYRFQYGFSFKWAAVKDVNPIITEEHLRIKLEEKGQKYNAFIDRSGNKAFYKSSITGRCSSKVSIGDTDLIINKLRAFDDLYYSEIIREINGLKFYMENNLDAKGCYQPDPFVQKGLDDLMIDALNLPRVIYQLQSEEPEKFELLKDIYSQLFPNIEDIIVKRYNLKSDVENFPENAPIMLTSAIYVLYVKTDNLLQPIDFRQLSDGAKRVFMILTKLMLAKISNVSLVAIEEPENSVHPSLFRAYMNIIRQLMDECRVIITSHSPYVISYLPPAWIKVGFERKNGIAEFFAFRPSGEKKLQNDAYDMNTSTGDYLFSLLADPDSNLNDYLECRE